MGRKPNPLFLEFFLRGAKLDDNSNRYEYDCKLCGKHFARGRSNHLWSHLITEGQCKFISEQDRAKVTQHLLAMNSGTLNNAKNVPNALPHAHPASSHRDTAANSLTGGDSGLTGLEALAEASRQVEHPKRNGGSSTEDVSIDLSLHRLGSGMLPNEYVSNMGYGQLAMSDPSPSVSYPGFNENLSSLPSSVPSISVGDMSSSISMVLENSDDPRSDLFDEPIPVRRSRPSSTLPRIAKAVTQLRTLAINRAPNRTPEPEMGVNGKIGKSRGKFSESRRKEISGVRKKGACIRCRMLRKICSEGDPCSSCSSIEHARVWKHQCLRTRLSQEFMPFSAGLFMNLAGRSLSNIEIEQQDPVTVLITQGPADEVSMMLQAMLYCENSTLTNRDSTAPTLLMTTPEDGVTKSLEEYANGLSARASSQEPSELIRTSLKLGLERSSATSDVLLSRVLQLWTLTQLFIDPKPSWKIQYRRKVNSNTDCSWETPDVQPNLSALDFQVRAAVEDLATSITKTVLQGLETRLLQRPKCQSFETFLIALILLNIVERTNWVFKTWQDPERAADWPLNDLPSSYSDQAQNFANLLEMLFKMRGVCVRVRVRSEFDNTLMPADMDDSHIRGWFDAVKLTSSDLEAFQKPIFDPNDPRSLDFSYASKLFIVT